MTMPRIVNAWQLLSLLVLMQSRTVAGQAFFMDGSPGCNSDGYGITIEDLDIECEVDNEDGACFFDDLVTISGTITYLAQLPTNVKVIPRLCHRNGYTCSEPLIDYTYIDLCDYLEDGDCPFAGTASFSAEMYLPNNDFIQDLYEWAAEVNQNLEENQKEWGNYNEQEEFECDDEDDRFDCEELEKEYEEEKERNENIYGYGTVGTVNPKFQLKVTFEPVQDLTIFANMYAGDRWDGGYNYNMDDEEKQEAKEQYQEQKQRYYQDKEVYSYEQAEAQEAWQEMVYAYMQEPTRSIFCHVPFRLVAEEYNVTAFQERNSYYHSWWYKFFNNMLSDCQITWTCEYEQAERGEGNTYYYAGSVGVLGLLGGVYRSIKKRRTVTEGDEGLVADENEKAIEFSSRRKEQLEGDDYVTMS